MGNAFDLARRIRIDTIQAMVEADVLSFEDGLKLLTEPLTPGDEQTRFDDSEHLACPKCHQKINGQTGEYPCSVCGLPTLHDQEDRPMALDQITVATVTLEDTDRIRQWFIDLEDVLDSDYTYDSLGEWLEVCYPRIKHDWNRLLFAYETIYENACDPTVRHLEWKPEIKAALELAAQGGLTGGH